MARDKERDNSGQMPGGEGYISDDTGTEDQAPGSMNDTPMGGDLGGDRGDGTEGAEVDADLNQ